MRVLGNGITAPVIAGLTIGVAFIVLFATTFTLKPAMAKPDGELIAETQSLAAVKYLTSKYPNAQVMVNRYPSGNAEVQYLVERQVCDFNVDDFSENCMGILSLKIVMKQLSRPVIVLSCPGSLTVPDDPIEYIESNDCFASSSNNPKVSVDLPRYTTD